MTEGDKEQVDWAGVTARCLAYLCLKNSPYAAKKVLEQAQFLEKLGLPIEDRAALIGSTAASLKELARQAEVKGGSTKNAKSKRR